MKVFCILGAVLALAASAAALDREAFTITRYDLNLRLEPAQLRLGVRGQITLRNDSSLPQRLAVLQISSSLNWRSIRLLADSKAPAAPDAPDLGQAVQFLTQPYTSDIDHTGELSEAIVTLPREVAPKGLVELAIGYEGVIILDATRLTRIGTPETVAWHSDWDQIGKTFTAFRGAGYVAWYPMALEAQSLSEGPAMFAALGKWKARHAGSRMQLRVEVLSSDVEKRELLVNGKGCVAAEAATEPVTLSGCVFERFGWANPVVVLGSYSETVSSAVQLQALPADAAVAGEFEKIAERAGSLVQDWLGPAREKATVVDLADADAAPFEADDWLLLPLAKANPLMEQTLLAHQLAHAALNSPRLWIHEGVAHFVQALAVEAADRGGRNAALEFLAPHREALSQAEKQAQGDALADTTQEVFYRSKAALVWWMLRDLVGDTALKHALHAYRAEDDTDSYYLQRLVAGDSKRDLTWFFHDWVSTAAGLPSFAIESANARKTTGTNFITAVTIANSGGAGAEVPITVHTASGDTTQRLEVRAKAKAVTRIATLAEPVEVIVNDGSVPEAGVGEHRRKIEKNEAQ